MEKGINTDSPGVRTGWKVSFWVFFTLLIAFRFSFFDNQIDEPHSWRQYDTAQYIRSLAHEDFDLFHPKVAWMGGHKTLILEFPLPEAITAVFYKLFGEHLIWARLVTLLFFAGAAVYFRAILRLVSSESIADLSAIVFLVLPLGIPYSRAVHIDPAALFFAHGFCYHTMRAIRGGGMKHMILGGIMAVFAALVKVPYLFYFAFPLAFDVYRQGYLRKSWKIALLLAPAIILFLLWQMHVHAVNNAAPDWSYIPEYHKFVNMSGWYFSTLNIRFMGNLWDTLIQRMQLEVCGGFLGWLPALLTLMVDWKSKGSHFMRFWALGLVVYLLIFFPLNVIHNYYQLPFLAPAAFFIAIFYDRLSKEIGKLGTWSLAGAYLFSVLLLFGNSARLVLQKGLKGKEAASFESYFKLEPALIAFGDVSEHHVPKGHLMIASYGGLDCRAPHLLYESNRYGWSIPTKYLNIPLIEKLKNEGAQELVVMTNLSYQAGWRDSCLTLYDSQTEVVPLQSNSDTKLISIFHLDRPAAILRHDSL